MISYKEHLIIEEVYSKTLNILTTTNEDVINERVDTFLDKLSSSARQISKFVNYRELMDIAGKVFSSERDKISIKAQQSLIISFNMLKRNVVATNNIVKSENLDSIIGHIDVVISNLETDLSLRESDIQAIDKTINEMVDVSNIGMRLNKVVDIKSEIEKIKNFSGIVSKGRMLLKKHKFDETYTYNYWKTYKEDLSHYRNSLFVVVDLLYNTNLKRALDYIDKLLYDFTKLFVFIKNEESSSVNVKW